MTGLSLDAPPERVAIVRLSAIGDTVHVLPVIASLRAAWPESRLSWVIQPGPLELMRGHPGVDEFIVFHRERGLRAFRDFRRELGDRRFDLVVDVHACLKAGVVTRLLPAPLRLGYDRRRARDLSWLATNRKIPPGDSAHVQDAHLEFLDYLGVPRRMEWDFHFTGEERAARRSWLRELRRPVLGVVTRSSRPDKDWIIERTARVLDVAAGDLGCTTVLLGGGSGGELADAERLRSLCRFPPRVELRYDLRRLAWLLDAVDVVLAPDTGPLHMAVALGTPTIGLYGSTDPKRAGPYRRFGDLLIDRYAPEGDRAPSRKRRPGNMAKIREEDVIEKLELALTRYPPGRGA